MRVEREAKSRPSARAERVETNSKPAAATAAKLKEAATATASACHCCLPQRGDKATRRRSMSKQLRQRQQQRKRQRQSQYSPPGQHCVLDLTWQLVATCCFAAACHVIWLRTCVMWHVACCHQRSRLRSRLRCLRFYGLAKECQLVVCLRLLPSLSLSVGVSLWLSRCLRVASNDDIINASLTEASGNWQVASGDCDIECGHKHRCCCCLTRQIGGLRTRAAGCAGRE